MKVTVKPLIIYCHSISKNLKTEKMATASCSIFPAWNITQVNQYMERRRDCYTIEKVSPQKDTFNFMDKQVIGMGQGIEMEKYWELNENGEQCLQISFTGDFQMEAPKLRMQLSIKRWPARGISVLDYNFPQILQCTWCEPNLVWGGQLFPMMFAR